MELQLPHQSFQRIYSVTQSCLILCYPTDCSTLGFLVFHHFPELSQTHVLPVIPFSSCLQSFPESGSFLMNHFFSSGGQSIGVAASASVLSMKIQGRFPLIWTGLISLQSKGLSRVFSTPQCKSINSSAFSLLYGPILTSIHDY